MKSLIKIENFKIGEIIERKNRFIIKAKINNRIILAHLNNTGRLEEFVRKGNLGLFLPIKKDKRKYRLSMIIENKSASIIDTSLQMKCFEVALEKGYLSWLRKAKILKRNFRINNSLIDYLIEHKDKKYILEIKSAAMKKGFYAMYPDCPSIRGQKHLKELINHKNSIILFIAGMKNIKAFKPNKDADLKIYELLKIAKQKGIKIKTIQIYFDLKRKDVVLKNDDLKVEI